MEMRDVFAKRMAEMMEKDPYICVLDADLANSHRTPALYKQFPDRCYECGIAEQNMASIAAGLSSYGFKPYISSFTPFATRRICDQIAISIAYSQQNVKIIGSDPGISAELNGGTHMSMEDIGVLRSIPGMVIFEPVDEVQLAKAMQQVNDYEGCLYIRLFRKIQPIIFGDDYEFDLFKADVLREGTDLTIVASGIMTKDALDVAEQLKNEGVSCDVISIHTVKPIDKETLVASARKTGAVVTLENHNVIGGLHSAVLEALAEEKVPVCKVGVPDRFGEVGKMPYLREVMGMTYEDCLAQAKKALSLK